MRLCFISPRYGEDIVGGAERLIRTFAEHSAGRGHAVEVLTTCASNHLSWTNDLPSGPQVIHGIAVTRFPVSSPALTPEMHAVSRKLQLGLPATDAEEELWMKANGYSESLLAAIRERKDETDFFIFAPYLFPSTVYGSRIAPGKSVVFPCLHPEPYASMRCVRQSLASVAGIACNARAESLLAKDLGCTGSALDVIGLGIDDPPDAPAAIPKGLQAPYLAYAGRQEEGKNFPLLVAWLEAANRYAATGAYPRLQLAAIGEAGGAAHPDVVNCGRVDEATKHAILAGALATVTLSINESFSYLIMESWLAGRPVIVNDACAVTRDFAAASGGGIPVRNPADFLETLRYFHDHPDRADAMGRQGRSFVASTMKWPSVMDRFEAFLGRLA